MFHFLILLLLNSINIPDSSQLYSLSVFSGIKIDTFDLTYISTVPNGNATNNMIIAKCNGAFFQKNGVLQGMSGSPVYFNGTLIGALSAAWADNLEPIVGITLIENMWSEVRFGLGNFNNISRNNIIAISTTGLDRNSQDFLQNQFSEHFLLVDGGGKSVNGSPFIPGGVICVQLAGGDATLAASGTITDIKGDTVIGFGHPFLGEGTCNYPMAGGYIHTVMPLRTLGFKLASPNEINGTIISDVSSGIAGIIGQEPEIINLKVNINSDNLYDTFSYWVCKSKLFTSILIPSLINTSLINSGIYSHNSYIDISTVIYLPDKEPIVFSNAYNNLLSFQTDWMFTIQIIVQSLIENNFLEIYPDSLITNISISNNHDELIIENVLIPESNTQRGDSLDIFIVLNSYQANQFIKKITIPIPTSFFDTTLGVLVTDAVNLPIFYDIKNLSWSNFFNIDQFLDYIRNLPVNNKLYVLLYKNTTGSYFNGKEIPVLPLTYLGALKYSNINSTPTFTYYDILYFSEIAMENIVRGAFVSRISLEEE